MSEAFASSLDTKNFAIIDGYAKAVSVLSRSHTPFAVSAEAVTAILSLT